MLTFIDQTIKCGELHSPLHKVLGELQVHRTYFWGLNGVSEIVGGMGAERIECDAWISDASFLPTKSGLQYLHEYLYALDQMRGNHGQVTEFRNINGELAEITYFSCTFEGAFRVALAGQERPKPCQLADTKNWVQAVTLVWTCLLDL